MFIIVLVLTLLFIVPPLSSIELLSYGVDGSSNNVNVVIKNRNPIVFFKYRESDVVSYFEIKLSTQSQLLPNTTIWYVLSTTSTQNTINYTTRVEIGTQLVEETTYYLSIFVYNINGESKTVQDWFYTTKSAVVLKNNVSLEIDYNNPFCPKIGEITKIRYMVKNKDVPVRIYLFSLSGEYIMTLNESVAQKDFIYTIDWDGKDKNGKILPQGMYIIVIKPLDDTPPVAKFVGIIDSR
jgi:hypothetical protein